MDMAIILNGVSKTFRSDERTVEAVLPVDVTCGRGSFTAILGPSGCGKTTLLRMMADLESPSSGTIRILDHTPCEARERRLIGMVFQRPALLPWRTAAQNIELTAEIAGVGDIAGQPVRSRVAELIDLVGLIGFEDAYPSELSGGMQSRVGIARALVLQPKVLLLDEPFAALDQITREKMQLELARICEQAGVTTILVTHSIPEAVFLSDRVLVMSNRPGCFIADIPVAFARPRRPDILVEPEFARLAAEMRRLLM